MPEIIGKILSKDSKSGIKSSDKTPYTRTAFKINGKIFSTFDNLNFNIGDAVQVVYEINGQYNNIQSMIKYEGDLPTETPHVPVEKPGEPTKNSSYGKEAEASRVAGMLISYVKDLVVAGKIEVGSLKSNVTALVETYKNTKNKLLE